MGNAQIRNLSDLCCEMKQFGKRTSQSSANGSFATQGTLADFSEALVLLCNEVIALQSEINELKALFASTKEADGSKPQPVAKSPRRPR